MRLIPFLCTAALWLASAPVAWAQGHSNDKKEKDKNEYKGRDEKDRDKDDDRYKEREKDKDDDRYKEREKEREKGDDRYKERDKDDRYDKASVPPTTRGKVGDILGRVILPPVGKPAPRQLEGVPRGHYPPPGQCRVWYPNRPPGQQPPPADCQSLTGTRLEPGAFILHGDQAYDAEYDWRKEETRKPGSVGRDILDILFPSRR